MNENEFYRMVGEADRSQTAVPALMKKVYTWMALALAITGITAYGVASSPNLLTAILSNQPLFWGLMIGELALVMFLSARLHKMSLTTATLMFVAYSVLNGVTMSYIFVAFSMDSIATTFFICAGTFAAMAIYGSVTKRDLSKMGSILFMGLLGLIIASVVNIFLHSTGLMMVISYIGVILFVGLTAWDTQKLKVMLSQMDEYDETGQKMALVGALELYLDFINLFLYLLRIFGNRE